MLNTILEKFQKQATQTPDNIALVDMNHEMTYHALDVQSSKLAHYLTTHCHVGTNGFIAVSMSHCNQMIVAILAVLKTGNAYVPIEPSFPVERIRTIFEDANISFVLTAEAFSHIFPSAAHTLDINQLLLKSAHASAALLCKPTPESIAYLLYTSGTTGKPKGVIITEKNVAHYIDAFRAEFKPSASDCMLQNSVCTFDIFTEEVFPILCAGGTLAIPNEATKQDMKSLLSFVSEHQVSMISAFPHFMIELNKEDIPSCIRLLISGGDVLRSCYVQNIMQRGIAIYNTYGPTETTVCATYYQHQDLVKDEKSVPIGKAVQGTTVYVLDKMLQPIQSGEIGEIYIAGAGVGSGYLNRPLETAKTFLDNPFHPGEKMYKSGDLAKLLPDGNLVFLKRNDKQVMVYGKRVELHEVEAVISQFDGVDFTTVQAFFDETENSAYLVSYLTGSTCNITALKQHLKKYLPAFMMPKYFVLVKDKIPLTANGKVNTALLPSVCV